MMQSTLCYCPMNTEGRVKAGFQRVGKTEIVHGILFFLFYFMQLTVVYDFINQKYSATKFYF